MFDITNDMDLSFLSMALSSAPIKPVELVKTANVNADYSSLPSDLFADPVSKQFPIHTPADAAISSLYIYKQASEVDEMTIQKVAESLESFGLEGLLPLLEGEQEMVKIASEENFLLPSKLKFPATDPMMLEKSASAANQFFDQMPLEDKVEVATNLIKVASEFDIDKNNLPKWAFVYGQDASCNLEKVAQEIGYRYNTTGNNAYLNLHSAIKNLYKEAGEISFDAGTNRRIALDLMEIDRASGVNYDEITDPFATVFNDISSAPEEIEKTAMDEQVTIGGVNFYKDTLSDFIESSQGAQIIGEDLYKSAAETYQSTDADAVIAQLQSLPEIAQETFADYLSQYVKDY